MNVLVLEASTTSAKAMVFNSTVGILRNKSVPYDSECSNVSIQDPDKILSAVIKVGNEMVQQESIDIICISGIWHSVLVTDNTLTPKTKSFSWAYTGASEIADNYRKIYDDVIAYYQKTGCMVHAMYPFFKLIHLQNEGLTIANNDKVMGQGTYIFSKLTGKLAESVSLASGSGLINIHELEWDNELLTKAGLAKQNMPNLVDHSYSQPIIKKFADLLGVKEGTPVLAAHPDGALNQVGSGALKDGIMTLSVGTSGAMRMAFDRPYIPDAPGTWCYYAPGKWLVGAATSGCTNCLDWFVGKFAENRYSFNDLSSMAAECESNPPVFLPFIFGERCPGWNDKRLGGFAEITGEHTIGVMYRGILEGILFNLYQCYEVLTQTTYEPKEIKVSGGIVKSKFWLQMLADILEREILIADSDQASMIGAACLGLLKCKEIPSLEDFQTGVQRKIYPVAENSERYKKEFARYLKYYNLKEV